MLGTAIMEMRESAAQGNMDVPTPPSGPVRHHFLAARIGDETAHSA